MQEFFENAFSGISIIDAIDIALVAFAIYKLLGLIRETRAEQILKGIVIIIIATVLAMLLHLNTLAWILKSLLALGAVAILVVFQPELRRALEFMGRSQIVHGSLNSEKMSAEDHIVGEIMDALRCMSADKTGALLVFERNTALEDIVDTGTAIDAEISDPLIENIFYEGSPLHDGAVIIREDRICAAGCVLPLSQSSGISKELGTRHRAGIGVTETSDAIAVIVSEETGMISVARNGVLNRYKTSKPVEKVLREIFEGNTEKAKGLQSLRHFFRGKEDKDAE